MSFSQGHALLVGVGTYRDQPNLNVPVCALDAEAVAEVLRDPNLCGYPANQVGLLRNATARRDDILIALDALADRAAESDTLFLFFCGHGAYGDDGDYYLTTHDTRVQDDRVVSGTGVREGELLERLRRVRAKRVLLVINACHSGGISPTLGATEAALTDTPLPSKTAAALLATGEGRIIITACREGQLSWIGKGKLSLFTQALVDGLQGRGTSSSRGFLNAFDLYTHLYFRVKDSVEREYRQDQEPELTVLKGVGPFAVALYRGATSLGGFADAGPPPEGTAAREIDPAYARAMLNQFQLHIGDTHQANLTGNGALAQGPGAQAVGAGGVLVGGTNTGPINTGTQVDTGGGAYVSGPVGLHNGHLIGRDFVQTVTQVIQGGEDPEEAKSVIALYLHALATDLAGLRLGEIDSSVDQAHRQPLQLSDVYVALDTTESIPVDSSLAAWLVRLQSPFGRDLPHAFVARPVSALEALAEHRELTLLGKPGGGKSTFGAYVLLTLAQAWQGHGSELANLGETWTQGALLPIRVVLRRFSEQLPAGDQPARAGDLWDFIGRDLKASGYGLSHRTVDYVQRIARDTGAFILLDGLDECGSGAGRERVLAAVRELMESAGTRCRFLLTARPYAWPSGPAPTQGVYSLADLNDTQTEQFIIGWYAALVRRLWLSPGEGQRKMADLLGARQRPDLAPLARNPLLLTLMATLHANRGRLPDDRADLYNESVDLLMLRWNRQIGADKALLDELAIPTLKLSDLREVLEELAFRVHGENVGQDGTADIGEDRLVRAFRPLLQGSRDKAAVVVDYIEKRAGLLVGQGEKDGERQFAFPHRTFQEFLAACHLAAKDDLPAECVRLARAAAGHWQVVLPLAARLAKAERGASAADELIGGTSVEELRRRRQPDVDDWTCALLAGMQLQEIGLGAIQKRDRTSAIRGRVADWIAASLPVHPDDGGLPAAQRAHAGDVLSALGDPRFDPERFYLPADDLLGFVHITADPDFRIGTRKADAKRVSEIIGYQVPEFDINDAPTPTPDFYIARYPVTVAQFRTFVEATGVQIADARALHDPDDLPFTWVQIGPAEWLRDPDNRPVRWVDWRGAMAYCGWLSGLLITAQELEGTEPARLVRDGGWSVGLPSELEWEKASRGGRAGALFPWGDAPDPSRANSVDSGINVTSTNIVTSTVGCFPANGFGLLDMIGNVWEWTRSRLEPYPYLPGDGRENPRPNGGASMVVRGGSLYERREGARCALRLPSTLGVRANHLGFRVVLRPPPVS